MSPTGEPPSYSAELHEQLRRSLNNPFTLHSDKENIRVLLDQIEQLEAEIERYRTAIIEGSTEAAYTLHDNLVRSGAILVSEAIVEQMAHIIARKILVRVMKGRRGMRDFSRFAGRKLSRIPQTYCEYGDHPTTDAVSLAVNVGDDHDLFVNMCRACWRAYVLENFPDGQMADWLRKHPNEFTERDDYLKGGEE